MTVPTADEAARTDKMIKDGMAAAKFFEEHQERVEQEQADREFLQSAILLGAMLLALIIRAIRRRAS